MFGFNLWYVCFQKGSGVKLTSSGSHMWCSHCDYSCITPATPPGLFLHYSYNTMGIIPVLLLQHHWDYSCITPATSSGLFLHYSCNTTRIIPALPLGFHSYSCGCTTTGNWIASGIFYLHHLCIFSDELQKRIADGDPRGRASAWME